jgi:hypothetical protein
VTGSGRRAVGQLGKHTPWPHVLTWYHTGDDATSDDTPHSDPWSLIGAINRRGFPRIIDNAPTIDMAAHKHAMETKKKTSVTCRVGANPVYVPAVLCWSAHEGNNAGSLFLIV